MIPRDLQGQRLTAVALLGWLLFNRPLLSLVDQVRLWNGIPPLYAWLFGAWALLIVLMAAAVARRAGDAPPERER